jgi:hypothetical protein
MHKHAFKGTMTVPVSKRWPRSRARKGLHELVFVRGVNRCICPRRHLRVLPTRTRPSLFGGD